MEYKYDFLLLTSPVFIPPMPFLTLSSQSAIAAASAPSPAPKRI